jgi:uncharacterized protein YjcR
MNNVNEIIDRMRLVTNTDTYADLADTLGVALTTINNWKRRGEVPEKNILKCIHLTNTTKEYLLFGIKRAENTSHIVNGNGNISFSGSGNNVSGNNTASSSQATNYNEEIKEVFDLLQEYGSPKMIKELKDRLLQIKALHG